MNRWLAWALVVGCTEAPPGTSGTTPTTTYTTWPTGTVTGTDADGDGWSVQAGDCDDADVAVNPGRDEVVDDGKDNDCDGRTDELFRGVVLSLVGDFATIPHAIVTVDPLGNEVDRVELQSLEVAAYFLTEGVNGGWAALDLYNFFVVEISASGVVTTVADFSKTAVYGFYGLTTHPDGYYLLTTADALWKVTPQGEVTEVQRWDPFAEMSGFDVAYDVQTGDVGVFGYYGSFALLHADGTWEWKRKLDPYNITHILWSGNRRDGGGWYMGGQDVDGWGMFRFDDTTGAWVRRADWDEQWTPHFMTVDGDSGDYYVTTEGGQYPYLYRITEDGTQRSVLWPELGSHTPGVSLWDLYTLY